jgi:hypothetical protein
MLTGFSYHTFSVLIIELKSVLPIFLCCYTNYLDSAYAKVGNSLPSEIEIGEYCFIVFY